MARRGSIVLVLLGLSAVGTGPAHAALKVSFVPAAAQLSPEGGARVLVLVQNEGDAAATGVTLRPLAVGRDGVDVALRPSAARDLPPGATRTWHATLTTRDALVAERAVTVVARARRGAVAGASLAVTSAPAADAAAVVEASAAHATLSARPGSPEVNAPILIKNHRPAPLRLTRVAVDPGEDIELDAHGARPTVPPGGTATLDLGVRVLDGARAGTTTAVVRLGFAGDAVPEAIVAQPIKVETPAHDALLLAIGIPGLVLVPGVIILATAALLWGLGFRRPVWDKGAFPVAFPQPQFWVAAVPLSVAVAAGARLLGVDLLDTQSLATVLWVWLVSAAIAVPLYTVLLEVRNRRHDRRTPTTGDDPIALLRKLDRQRLSVRLRRFSHGEAFVYMVQSDEGNPETCWFAPGIAVGLGEADDDLVRVLRELVDGSGDAGRIADALERGRGASSLTVGWVNGGPAAGPRHLSVADLEEDGASAIVQEV